MKTLILIFTLFFSLNLSAQWVYKTITDGFDDPYKIAYTDNPSGAYLKLENVEGKVAFYIKGGYYCDDVISYDFVFQLGQEVYKVSGVGVKNESSDIVFFTPDLLNEEYETVNWFKKCSKLKIRINESYCTNSYYEFNMSKSSSALDFMSKP
jgi:hypothetical protein